MFISAYMRFRPSIYILAFMLCFWLSPSVGHAQEDGTSLKEKKTKEGFLIDLKSLVSRSKEKIEEANVKIEEQERYKRNQQREEKAREYYAKGKKLYDEGKFDKANEFFERAVKITEHPEMKGYVRESSAKTKKEQKALTEAEERRLKQLEEERGFKVKEVEKTYAKAVALFKKQKYLEARDAFQEVDKMFPDHKATRSYLMLITQRIQEEQDSLIAKKLETDTDESRQEKEGWKNELERKAQARREQLEKQADKKYNEALEYYKQKQFVQAKESFKEVEWVLPNYKSTVKYLKKLDKEIKEDDVLSAEDKQRLFEKQMREERAAGKEVADTKKFDELKAATDKKELQKRLAEEADFVYKSAISLYKKKSFEQAKDMFMKVEDIYPGYQKTRDYLAKIEKVIPEHQRSLVKLDEKKAETDTDKADEKIKKQVIERRTQYEDEAEQKYKEATDFYRRQNYVEAKIKFIQVEALYADYKDTRTYLAKIDQDISAQVQKGDDKAIRGLEVAWQESNAPETAKAAAAISKEEDVGAIYKEAVRAYKDGQYKLAEDQFDRLNQISPGYKATDKYLSNIHEKLTAGGAYVPPMTAPVKSAPTPRVDVRNFKEEAKATYKQAVGLYKKKHFVEARRKFVEANELVPGYKSTKGYIAKLNKIVPSIYWDEKAKEPTTLVKENVPPVEKTVIREESKEEPIKEATTKKEPVKTVALDERIDEDYRQAITYFNDREYAKARDLFNDVNRRSPDYKMAAVYLERIDKRINEPQTAEKTVPSKGTTSPEPAEVASAKERKQDNKLAAVAEGRSGKSFVHSFKEDQKELAKEQSRFNEQKNVIARLSEESRQEDAALYERQISGLYNEAVQLFNEKKYNEAKMKFSAVNTINPGYKAASKYLSKIDRLTIVDEEKAKIAGEIEQLKSATKQAEAKVKEMKSKPEPVVKTPAASGQEVAGATAESTPEHDALVTSMAQEWKTAEAEVQRLKDELKEKEMALKWRTDEETRLAEIMALEDETERLEHEKYETHQEQLQAHYQEEEKALEASNKRIDDRVQQLKEQYKMNAQTKDSAQRDAQEDIEEEKEALRRQRDQLLDADANRIPPPPEKVKSSGKTAEEAPAQQQAAAQTNVSAQQSSKKDFPTKKITVAEAPPVKEVKGAKAAQNVKGAKQVEEVAVDKNLSKELQSLQASIANQEQQLEQDRQTADARLQQEKQRIEQAGETEREKIMKTAMVTPKKKAGPVSFEERYRLYSEEENEQALSALVRARQKELRYERERIREEFQVSLDELYNKAVDLYQLGRYEEAHRMFNEINVMAPSYKKTSNYLAKFEEAEKEAPKQVVDQYGTQIPKIQPRQSSKREEAISNILDQAEATF